MHRYRIPVFDGEETASIMIIDLQKFITEERPFWQELETLLDKLEKKPEFRLNLARLERFH